jgi:hypothetical protein
MSGFTSLKKYIFNIIIRVKDLEKKSSVIGKMSKANLKWRQLGVLNDLIICIYITSIKICDKFPRNFEQFSKNIAHKKFLGRFAQSTKKLMKSFCWLDFGFPFPSSENLGENGNLVV